MSSVVNKDEMNAELAKAGIAQWFSDSAWEDGSRGVEDGTLSCLGSNITDRFIVKKSGGACPYLQPQDSKGARDERIVIAGTDMVLPNGDTIDELLQYAEYYTRAGVTVNGGISAEAVVKRFKHCFIRADKETEKFSVDQYHYNGDASNLVFLVHADGVAVYVEQRGQMKLLPKSVDSEGRHHQHYFTATASRRTVGSTGGVVEESKVGEARDNRVVVITVPLLRPAPLYRSMGSMGSMDCCATKSDSGPAFRSMPVAAAWEADVGVSNESAGIMDATSHTVEQDPCQPVCVTIMSYNVVCGAVLSEKDILAAAALQEETMKEAGEIGLLSNAPFMLRRLTEEVKKECLAGMRFSKDALRSVI
ncbi:MAG: hypothetical protein CL902_00415 [Dehalococcoidia bacterium]|nr:hypothetical protein [Dehalococcoidia bacterium]